MVTTRLFSLSDWGSIGVETGVIVGTAVVLGGSTTRVGSTAGVAVDIISYE